MKTEQIKSVVIAVLVLLLYFTNCKGDKTTVAIPEIKGSFEAVKPTQKEIKLIDNSVGVATTEKTRGAVNQSEIDRLKKEYNLNVEQMANEVQYLESIADSLGLANFELQQIIINHSKVKEFKQTFDDVNLKANVSGIVFKNEVQSVNLDYTIKERQIKTAVMKGFFAGGQIGSNKELNQFTYKIDADFLYDTTIYKSSYQRFGNEYFFLIGGSVKLF